MALPAEQQRAESEAPRPATQVIDVMFADQTEDYLEAEAALEVERERLLRLQEAAESGGR